VVATQPQERKTAPRRGGTAIVDVAYEYLKQQKQQVTTKISRSDRYILLYTAGGTWVSLCRSEEH